MTRGRIVETENAEATYGIMILRLLENTLHCFCEAAVGETVAGSSVTAKA